MGNYQTEIDLRDEEIARLKAQLLNRDDEIKVINVKLTQASTSHSELEKEVEFKCSEINKTKVKLAETEKALDDLFLSRKSEGAIALELEHLKADN